MLISDDDLHALAELAGNATQDRWQWGHSGTSTLEAASAYVANQIARSDDPDVQMVYIGDVAGDVKIVAVTGNGPTSAANAQYLTALQPSTILALIREVQAARIRGAR